MTHERSAPDEGGRRYWDRLAAKYDRSMLLLGRPFPRMLQLIEDELRGMPAVLEVASGTGLVTVAIARAAARVVATDYAHAMVERTRDRMHAERLTNVECLVRDVYALDLPRASFDAVVCANVLHLVPDADQAIRAMAAMLRPGGKLVAPTFVHDQTGISRTISRVLAMTGFPSRRCFSEETLRSAIANTGFAVEKVETIAGPIPITFIAAKLPS